MRPIATVAAVQAADKAAQEGGTPVEVLMGRAGAAVARAATAELGRVAGRRVVALAGKGHNGGDALEALARLARRGAGAEALVTGDPDDLDTQGRRCVALVRRAGGRVRPFSPELADWAHLLGALRWHLTLSDTRDTAYASVLVEGPDDYPRRPPGPPPWVRRRLDRQRGTGS